MTSSQPKRVVQFDPFELDLSTAELRRNGEKVRLQEQSFQILEMLLEHPGEVVSRDEIQKKLWPDNTIVEFENSVNAAVMRLRQALADSADSPRFIETVPRRGYRFVAHVDVPAQSVEPPLTGSAAQSGRRWISLRMLGIAAVCAAAVWLLAMSMHWDPGRLISRSKHVTTVAVLPFENLSRDPNQAYFADGFTDELITTLAQIRALRVISRTSVIQYQGSKKNLRQIARELNVDAVLEGTVMHTGDRVRITAQLIQAGTDTHLWADTYERDVRDVLHLQNEVARSVANAVRAQLSTQESSRLASTRSVDPHAQEAYLKGQYYANSLTDQNCTQAIDYFKQAIAVDPNYAEPYAGLSGCYIALSIFGPLPAAEAFPKAKEAALQAIRLDQGLGSAHAWLAGVHFLYEWNWKDAGVEFERSLELSPGAADAHIHYASYLIAMRRSDEALVHLRTGKTLDPISQRTNLEIGWLLTTARKYDEAIQQFRELLNVYPDFMPAHMELGRALYHKGLHKEAGAEWLRAHELSDDNEHEKIAFRRSYAASGTEGLLRTNFDMVARAPNPRTLEFGALSALLGEKDRAFGCLLSAYRERSQGLAFLKADPDFDNLHGDPRFDDLARRVGLP
jgi:TolB-like protein/DNA-binding winged helix-turn-helix (wHTH) protein